MSYTSGRSQTGNDRDGLSRYTWSPGLRLDPLIDQAEALERLSQPGRRVARQLSCQARDDLATSCRFHVGICKHPHASGVALVTPYFLPTSVIPPLTIRALQAAYAVHHDNPNMDAFCKTLMGLIGGCACRLVVDCETSNHCFELFASPCGNGFLSIKNEVRLAKVEQWPCIGGR